jgi:hypothetical protein
MIMMSFLISLIGETYGQAKKSAKQIDYYQLALTVRRLEANFCCQRRKHTELEYLVVGREVDLDLDEEGEVN